MRWRPIFLPVMLLGCILWISVWKFFNWLVVWLVEGGIDRALTYYEAWWEGVREPILLGAGIMIAFFLLSIAIGFVADCWGRRSQ